MAGRGFQIARLFGIDIRVDWSWLFIFALVTWNLGAVFGTLHPDWSGGLRWSIALIAALLFFGSVLAHELAHSLVSRAQGTPVRNITLFLFGGVSNIQSNPDTPRKEFTMAIVGPLTSLVIGVAMILLASAATPALGSALRQPAGMLSALSPATTVLFWLGSVNIILAIFNMVPGFPLDGGRVLRSILWAITKNLRKATRWAAWAGQAVAWALIITGVAMALGLNVPFFGTGLLGGLWLVFIGWFLNSAASQSYQQVVIQNILEGVPVRRMMRVNPPTVSPAESVAGLVDNHVMRTEDRAFPVMSSEGRLVGIVTIEDIRKVTRADWDRTSVQAIMTPGQDLVTVSPEDDAYQALNRLGERDVNQLLVVEGGNLAGMLRRRDLIRWLQLNASDLGGRESDEFARG